MEKFGDSEEIYLSPECPHIGVSRVAPNCLRLATNWTNLGHFKISFLFILARSVDLKNHLFVPFGANLALLEAKYGIPSRQSSGLSLESEASYFATNWSIISQNRRTLGLFRYIFSTFR